MIKGIESDIDKHMYEYNLVINICKNSYRYFKVIDKVFEKLQKIYDESLDKDIIDLDDYIKMYKEIYDMKIKTKVNDVHRTINTEDEYLEYSKLVTADDVDESELNNFILERAIDSTTFDEVKQRLQNEIKNDDIDETLNDDSENEVENKEDKEEKNEEEYDKEDDKKEKQTEENKQIKDLDEKQIEEIVLDESDKQVKRRRGRPRKDSN